MITETWEENTLGFKRLSAVLSARKRPSDVLYYFILNKAYSVDLRICGSI